MTASQVRAHPLVRTQVGGAGWDFNAAHTGMHDGVFEPFHGHTYQVTLTACGTPDEAGVLVDFGLLKNQLRQVIAPLKRRTLIAARIPGVSVEHADGGQVTVRGGGAFFSLPGSWVTLLPIKGTSTEALAAYLVAELAPLAGSACPAIERLELTLAESAECAATVEAVLR